MGDCPTCSTAHAEEQKQSRIVKCTTLWIQVVSYLKTQNKTKKQPQPPNKDHIMGGRYTELNNIFQFNFCHSGSKKPKVKDLRGIKGFPESHIISTPSLAKSVIAGSEIIKEYSWYLTTWFCSHHGAPFLPSSHIHTSLWSLHRTVKPSPFLLRMETTWGSRF